MRSEICRRITRNICDFTRAIDGLNIETDRLKADITSHEATLSRLGWSRRQLEQLANSPDTGALLNEIERRAERRRMKNELTAALRH